MVVGDCVEVMNRTWAGSNKHGGVAIIKAVLGGGERYNVKYSVGNRSEKGVEAKFIRPHIFPQDEPRIRSRRGGISVRSVVSSASIPEHRLGEQPKRKRRNPVLPSASANVSMSGNNSGILPQDTSHTIGQRDTEEIATPEKGSATNSQSISSSFPLSSPVPHMVEPTLAGAKHKRRRVCSGGMSLSTTLPTTPSMIGATNAACFGVGDIVDVQARTSPGLNRPGGVARVSRVRDDGTYDVKYVVSRGGESGLPANLLSLLTSQ
ncbi:unnamed protein product, partial [Choristocarpus tenellus]